MDSGWENESEMFDIIRTGEGGVPGGEEPNTNVDISDFLNPTGDGMEQEESDGRREPPEDESDDCDDDGNVVGQVYILINPHSIYIWINWFIVYIYVLTNVSSFIDIRIVEQIS